LDVLGIESDLDTSFVVDPQSVAPGDSLLAELVVRNPSSDTVTLAGAGCLAGIRVLKDGESLLMEGADFVCTMPLLRYHVPPHDSLVVQYPLRAMLRRDSRSPTYDIEAEPGVYTLRTWMTVDLADLECEFTVVR